MPPARRTRVPARVHGGVGPRVELEGGWYSFDLIEAERRVAMSAKAIYEADGKELLSKYLRQTVLEESALRSSLSHKAVVVNHLSDLNELTAVNPWMTSEVSSRQQLRSCTAPLERGGPSTQGRCGCQG